MSLVECKAGQFEGVLQDCCHEFYGIPYAKYEERWDKSVLIDKELNLEANEKGNSAPQTRSDDQSQQGTSFFQDNSLSKQSEDCLTLNICTNDTQAKNPVIIWIHGGALVTGGSSSIMYDLQHLARRGVVVVSINYRLGPLGFLKLDEATDGRINSTGNEGLIDQRNAIKWVRDNISSFGGDPKNITIFGESAGGHNVLALLASPLSENLFQKAISQSGYTATSSLERAHNRNNRFPLVRRGSWQVTNDLLFDKHSLTDQKNILKNLDAREFIGRYSHENQIDSIPLSTRDGVVIPLEGIASALGNPRYAKKIPVMSGTTKDEVSLWHGLHRYFVDIKYPLSRFLPPFYRIKDQGVFDLWIRTRSHAWKIRGSDEPLRALQRAGYTELYSYQFDWDHQKPSIFADFRRLPIGKFLEKSRNRPDPSFTQIFRKITRYCSVKEGSDRFLDFC